MMNTHEFTMLTEAATAVVIMTQSDATSEEIQKAQNNYLMRAARQAPRDLRIALQELHDMCYHSISVMQDNILDHQGLAARALRFAIRDHSS